MLEKGEQAVRPTFAQAQKEIAKRRCLTHPGQILVLDRDLQPQCNECRRQGTELKLAPLPDRGAERLGKMVNEREIAVREGQFQEITPAGSVREQAPLTVEVFKERIALVKAVTKEMEEGVHYGIIPGTQGKSLWEPGAEYLRMAFGITWNFEMLKEEEDYATGDFHYSVRAFALSPDGAEVASWPGSAWSKERRFWCKKECPKNCDQTHEPSMERNMLPHNVKDRAIKRAFVALIRNVTGTTGYFTQALDTATGEIGIQGGYAATIPCPDNGKEMRLRDGKFGQYYSHKHGSEWHNIDADKAPQPVQQPPPGEQQTASEPEQAPQDSEGAQTTSFEDRKLLFLEKVMQDFPDNFKNFDDVAHAANYQAAVDIEEGADLRKMYQDIAALYGGK